MGFKQNIKRMADGSEGELGISLRKDLARAVGSEDWDGSKSVERGIGSGGSMVLG